MAIANTIQSMQSNLKSVYDKITDIPVKNLFNVNTIVNDGISSDSGATWGGTDAWRLSDYIKVNGNTQYNFSWESTSNFFQINICYYNSSKSFISGISYSESGRYNASFTTPSNCEYIRIAYSVNVSSQNVERNNIQLELGNTRTTYVPYLPPKNLQNLSTTIQSELDNIYSKVIDKGGSLRTKNLLNGGSGDKWFYLNNKTKTFESVKNGFLLDNTLDKNYSASRIAHCEIALEKGKTYYIKFDTKNIVGNANVQAYLPQIDQYITSNGSFVPNDNVSKIGLYVSSNYLQGQISKIEITNIIISTENIDYIPYEYEKNLYNLSKVIDSIPNE